MEENFWLKAVQLKWWLDEVLKLAMLRSACNKKCKVIKVEHWEKLSKMTLRGSPIALLLEDRLKVQYRTEGSCRVEGFEEKRSCRAAALPHVQQQDEQIKNKGLITFQPPQFPPLNHPLLWSIHLKAWNYSFTGFWKKPISWRILSPLTGQVPDH